MDTLTQNTETLTDQIKNLEIGGKLEIPRKSLRYVRQQISNTLHVFTNMRFATNTKGLPRDKAEIERKEDRVQFE